MPPKKTKAQEALAFLDDLDSFEPDAAPAPPGDSIIIPAALTPRPSSDSARPVASPATSIKGPDKAEGARIPDEDPEAASALAFLEAQLAQKRAPLSKATPPPTASPTLTAKKADPKSEDASAPASASGWGSSWWSSASAALQQAQKVADERYKQVRTEGVGAGVAGIGLDKLDLDGLRRGAGERLNGISGIVKGVDLEKLRADLLSTTTSALTDLINTVAPPISEHETLELWLTHPLVGYAGVEGVVYRGWTRILEQTESGELVVVWSPPTQTQELEGAGESRSINPVQGWAAAWTTAEEEIKLVRERETQDPKGRAKANPNLPVTTVPIFLHLLPVLAPLPIPEPPILLESEAPVADAEQAKHLSFLLTLQDPSHRLRFTTVSQSVPADWLDVEYDRSDWVEERLVDVLRAGVEVIAQEYVATRMALKRPATQEGEGKSESSPAEDV